MAGNNETKIVLTAEDKTAAAFGSVSRGLKQMEDQAAMASRALGAIGVTVSAAAMVAMVKGTIDAADGFNDLSQRVGINIRQLAGWSLAANQSGTSMESVAKGIKGLSTYMGEHGDRLRAAGVTATDANGAMIQLADIFKAMPDGVEKTALAVQLFGKAGMDMIPMLNQGSAGLADAQQKADSYGKKMEELAPQADHFNDQVEELALHMKALGINITGYVIKPLTNMATALNDLAAGGDRAEKKLAWLADQGHPIAKAVMAWSKVFGAMGIGENRSQGYGGPTNAQGLPMSEEEMFSSATDDYMAGRAARARGRVLGGGGAGATGAAKAAKKAALMLPGANNPGEAVTLGQIIIDQKAEEAQEKALEKRRIAMEEMAEKRMEYNRISTEGEEAIRESLEKTGKAGKDMFAGLTDAVESWGNKAADTFADFVVDGKASFSDLANSILKDIVRLQAKSVLDPITKGASGFLSSGIGKLFDGFFGGGGGGSGGFNIADSFAGGGYTGSGARSGGMDGQGGFLAMLHPNETVIDHAQGGSGGGAVTVILNISTGVAQTVRAEISNLLPSISASVQGAVMDARLRGGSTRAAYRG